MEERQVTSMQVAAALASTIIGVGVLELPRLAVAAAGTGGPMVTLMGALIGLFGLILLAALGIRFPTKSIIEYSEVVLGRWLAFIASLSIVLFFALLTALAAREFGEVVVTSVLQRTPLEVTVIVMLLLSAISVRTDIGTFVGIHLFYLPFMVAPGLAIVVLSLKNSHLLNLLPVLGNEHHFMMSGILTIAALFQGSFVLTMMIPYMRNPKKAFVSSYWGWGIAGGLYLLIVIAAVAVFGPEEIKLLMWPTLELAKTTSLPANILERLDAAFLAVWVTAVFTTLFSTYYITIKAISSMFHLKAHKKFSFFMLPFIFLTAMLPQSVLQMYEIIQIVGQIGLIVTIGYPVLLWIIALIRKKRGDRDEDARSDSPRAGRQPAYAGNRSAQSDNQSSPANNRSSHMDNQSPSDAGGRNGSNNNRSSSADGESSSANGQTSTANGRSKSGDSQSPKANSRSDSEDSQTSTANGPSKSGDSQSPNANGRTSDANGQPSPANLQSPRPGSQSASASSQLSHGNSQSSSANNPSSPGGGQSSSGAGQSSH